MYFSCYGKKDTNQSWGNVTFLFPNKKVTKEGGIGEALSSALSSALRAACGGCALHAPAGAAASKAALSYVPHPAALDYCKAS